MNKIYSIISKIFEEISRNVNAIIVAAIFSVAAFGFTSYLVSIPVDYNNEDLSIVREYIVNARTLKIHKIDCPAVSKMKWSNINSKGIAIDAKSIQYALQMLGFEIYDYKYRNIDVNDDGYYEGIINKIDSTFKLKRGDILARDGHVHFYISDEQNFGWGKVNNVYPQNSSTYIDYSNCTIVCNGETFTRVYRYVGNDSE